MSTAATVAEMEQRIAQQIAETLRTLLQQRHLYQSLEVKVDSVIGLLAKKANPSGIEQHMLMHAHGFFLRRWFAQDPSGQMRTASASGTAESHCVFEVPYIKTYCEKCERVEPFNPVAAVEPLAMHQRPEADPVKGVVQNFVLAFRCQGCKGVPEVFLVRRVGPKLTIAGRSPIEYVEVAKVIPDAVKRYVSGATVAHQSGQTLAGLFLLRTTIEQWIRSLGADHEKADQALEWYMSTLPDDFKQRFPSLRDLYGKLSDALHKADASAPLFDQSKADMETHFEARKLYKLADPKFARKADSGGAAAGTT